MSGTDHEPDAPEPGDEPVEVALEPPRFASAPGVGTQIGAVNVSTLGPLGWAVMAAGIAGTLLLALSYLLGWLTASLEQFGAPETESLTLGEVTSGPLAWMYRVATLALVGSAMALVFVPRRVRQILRLAGFAAAGLSLLSALVATVVIATILSQGAVYFGDADTVEFGWGLYTGYLGIVALASFVGFFDKIAERPGRL